ncbi:MAG TPA: GNAT family N-acetyltransferase [Candidatus Dormibacteraeota bacterium]|nr:GNAT family N-acetyltransferase [Candidatus Dormibacteraeota bacterium]
MKTLRPLAEHELPAFLDQVARSFSGSRWPPEDVQRVVQAIELERAIGVFEDGTLVATAAAQSMQLTVPGGSAPAVGIGRVSVLPTHRRQGLLTEMMRHLVAEARDRGEPLAALFSSEGGIYGRFGFGVATYEADVRVQRARSAFRSRAEGTGLRLVQPVEAADTLARIAGAVTDGQPGAVRRGREWWRFQAAAPQQPGEPEWQVVVRAQQDGFVVYRTHGHLRPPALEGGSLEVGPLFAVSPQAYAALWRYCLDVDLMDEVTARHRSVDEPLRHLLADPRAMECTAWDGLWLRLVDVEAALRARRYARADRLVLHIEDGFCPWNTGTYALEAGEPRRVTEPPDLVLPTDALGACYLGGNRFVALASAGVVAERVPGAAARADAVFASPLTPWCPYHF